MGKKKKKKNPAKGYEALYNQGLQQFRQGHYKETIKLWREANKLRKSEELSAKLAQAHFRYALSFDLNKNHQQIISELHQSVQYAPNIAIYRYHIGLAYHRQKSYPKAIAAYREALRLSPQNQRFLKHLQFAQIEAGQFCEKEASEDFRVLQLLYAQQYQEAAKFLREKKQQSLRDNIYLAFVHTMSGEYREAKKLWKECQDSAEYAPLAYYYNGMIYARESKWTSAIKNLEVALREPSLQDNCRETLLAVLKYQAFELTKAGDPKKAKTLWDKIAALDPNDEFSYNAIAMAIHKGYSYAIEGNLTQAMRTWRRILNKSTEKHPLLLQNYAIACDRQENYPQALESWQELAQVWKKQLPKAKDPKMQAQKLALVFRRIAEIAAHLEDFTTAKEACQKAVQYAPEDVEMHLRLVVLDFNEGNFEKALTTLKRLHKLHPRDIYVLELLITACLQTENLLLAVEYGIAILKLEPKHPQAREFIRYMGYDQAATLFAQDWGQQAFRLLETLLEIDSGYASFYTLRAEFLFDEGQNEAAEEQLQNAIEQGENKALAHAEVGKAYINVGRPTDALVHLRQAEELAQEGDYETFCCLTVAYMLHDQRKGDRYLKKLCAITPNNPELYGDIANGLAEAERQDLALTVLKRGARKFPLDLDLGMSLVMLAIERDQTKLAQNTIHKVRQVARAQEDYELLQTLHFLELMIMFPEEDIGDFF